MTLRSIYFILLSLLFSTSQTAVITVPPVSVTAPIYTTATFTCEGTGDTLNWLVQSSVLTYSIKQEREITVTTTVNNTNFSSVLTVNAIPINDGIAVGCEVISYNLSNPSNPINRVISSTELTIRGISSIENLKFSFPTYNSLQITWSRLTYYSNDVPFGSPVSYQVLVTDEDEDIILDTITNDTNITVANVTDCDAFNISIRALVYQYTSVDTTVSNGSLGYNATITTNEVNFLTPNVSIELSCPPSKCNAFLIITSGSDVIDQYTFTGTDGVVHDTRTLSPSLEYNYTVRVFNTRDKLEYETYTIITTYQVIGLYIADTYTNGSVSVQCIYQLVSTADGCHVIFTDTSNGRNESFNIIGSNNTIVSLASGNYTVTVYDVSDDGALFGPAVQYPAPVEIFKIAPYISSSSSNPHESTTESTVSPTITNTPGTETETSPTSGTINDANNVVPIVAGIPGGIVLVVLIILAVCVGITVNKRKKMKEQVLIRSENATIHQPQAKTNHYQAVHELINEVPIATKSQVIVTSNRPIDEENPYHVTMSEFLPDSHMNPSHNVEGLNQQVPCPSLTSTTTQEDSISSSTTNDIHNDTPTCAVANVTPVPPAAVDQHTVAGDNIINKAADFPEIPPPPGGGYNDLDAITEPSTESGTVSPQAAPNKFFYSEAEEVLQVTGTSTLCPNNSSLSHFDETRSVQCNKVPYVSIPQKSGEHLSESMTVSENYLNHKNEVSKQQIQPVPPKLLSLKRFMNNLI